MYLQDEVAQLSAEIDRIAATTQFNGINVLDGGFQNKSFQIGANAGQTMGISIGDMRSSVLGVASGAVREIGASSAASTSSTNLLASARGSEAVATQVRLTFPDALGGQYSFDISDYASGLTATVTATLDATDAFSKTAFLDEINKELAQSARDVTATGTNAFARFDIDDSDNYDKLKFAIKLGDGSLENIDIRQALRDAGVSGSATTANVFAAIESELRSVFGDDNQSIDVSAAAGNVLFISDAEGRRIEVYQGAGDGTLFGTDADNDGGIIAEATTPNGISAAWDGDAVVLTNASGAQVSVHTFATNTTGASMVVDAVDGQNGAALDPTYFVSAATSSITGDDSAKFVGVHDSTQVALTFSNREEIISKVPRAGVTYATATVTANAKYGFDITNGDGDVYASLVLDIEPTQTDAQVIAAVRSAITAGLAANFTGDHTIDINEFDISFNDNTLVISNTGGRAIKVENFESYAGTMTVASLNALGSSVTLASTTNLFSEGRIGVNMGSIGVDHGTAVFNLFVAGQDMSAPAGITVDLDGTTNATLTALADAIQSELRLATTAFVQVNGSNSSAQIDMSFLTVTADTDTNELIIRHPEGYSVTFGLASTDPLYNTGVLFTSNSTTALDNTANAVKLSSGVIQGNVTEATQVAMTLNADSGTFGFTLNGEVVAATAFDATVPFAGTAFETALNTAIDNLNANHPSAVFSYAVSGRTITFRQSDGGEIDISAFTTSGNGDDVLKATIEALSGTTGATKVAQQYDTGMSATAEAVAAEGTEVVLTLSADDMYSLVLNDGTTDYSFGPVVVDISDSNSTQSFASQMETALRGSGMSVGMDTSGRVYITREDGGAINIKSFNSAGSGTGTWSPKAGQGDAVALTDTGVAVSSSSVTGSSIAAGGGSVAVSQIDVSTQAGAAAALAVIDSALDYVNSERAKLGAVENRLTHTIDNLSNIVTNTQASQSRIEDTDYAAETAELARAQIIQQAATAMLAQANQSSQSVLSLLQ